MLKIKVCGLKYPQNIEAVSSLPLDYLGFICYPKSPRYVGLQNRALADNLLVGNQSAKRVGVFVNANQEEIREYVSYYRFDMVQLHGTESPDFCQSIQEFVPVIKAFSLENQEDLAMTPAYEEACAHFLFDTKTPAYGGSGQKFNWQILESYSGKTSFMLSGGIGAADVVSIKNIQHPLLLGVDLNSRFELKPGLKNINQIETFIKQLNNESY